MDADPVNGHGDFEMALGNAREHRQDIALWLALQVMMTDDVALADETLVDRLIVLQDRIENVMRDRLGLPDRDAGSPAGERAEGERAVSVAACVRAVTQYLDADRQRNYRVLMKKTLEALETELAPASRDLLIIREDTANLPETLVTASNQVTAVLRVIQLVRARLDEAGTNLDEESGPQA